MVSIDNPTNLTAAFDWLEFTVQHLTLNRLIEGVLRLNNDEFKPLKCGKFGYNTQLKWADGNLFILFNADQKEAPQPSKDDPMGIHVIITGTGCRTYEKSQGLQELILCVIGGVPSHKFTRIDLAIDDRCEKLLRFERIHRAAIAGHFTSRWNKWEEINSRKCADGQYIGRTMYFGSQKSDLFIRIYDKKLERLANNPNETDPNAANWTRLEVVYKKDRAQMLAEYLVDHEDIGCLLRQTLNNYIRFIVQPSSTDTNKSRWPTAKWWQALIGDVAKLSLTIQPLDRTIDQMQEWVNQQISPTIAAIMTAHDGEIDWLYDIIATGKTRLRAKHKDAISQFKN